MSRKATAKNTVKRVLAIEKAEKSVYRIENRLSPKKPIDIGGGLRYNRKRNGRMRFAPLIKEREENGEK